MALATRALGARRYGRRAMAQRRIPPAVLKIAQRTISEGAAREGKVAADIGPDDARALLEAWLRSIELDLRGRDLLAYLQADDFSHADLYRRARRTHERRLRGAVAQGSAAAARGDVGAAFGGLFDAVAPGRALRARRPPSSAPRRRSWPAGPASGRGWR